MRRSLHMNAAAALRFVCFHKRCDDNTKDLEAQCFKVFEVAGAEGFEPSTKVLETHVLPLHQAPNKIYNTMRKVFCQGLILGRQT